MHLDRVIREFEECRTNPSVIARAHTKDGAEVLVRTKIGEEVIITVKATDIRVENGRVVLIGDLDEAQAEDTEPKI
jgi:formylmethanofuran dehydrogenase subunit D